MYERSAVSPAGPLAGRLAERLAGVVGMLALAAGLAAGAVLLHATAGPPRLPETLPTAGDIGLFLRGSEVPWQAVGYVSTTLAWLLLAWMTGTLALRVVVALALIGARGAAWAQSLRAVSDRITLPLVRRVVDRALVAGLVVSLAGRAAPVAADGLPPVAPASADHSALADQAQSQTGSPHYPPRPGSTAARATLHVVAPGENLWRLAERYYGAGEASARIAAANAGRAMADGARFTEPNVIRPGWTLEIPERDAAVEEVDGALVYTVQPGDTLGGIAERYLGSRVRWLDLFELNRHAAATPDGLVLTSPDLIWPGLSLVLPAEAAPTTPADEGGPPAAHASPQEPGAEAPRAAVTYGERPSSADAGPRAVDVASAAFAAELDHHPLPPSLAASPPPPDSPPEAVSAGQPGTRPALLPAVAAVAGAAALAVPVRRRARRSLREAPLADDEQARAALARQDTLQLDVALASRRGGIEPDPSVVIAEHVRRLFDAAGDGAASPLWATLRRSSRGVAVDLVLRSGLDEPRRLAAVARDIAARLGCRAAAAHAGGSDVALSLTGLRPALLAVLGASAHPIGEAAGTAPPMLPLGMAPGAAVLSANWRELGHVLIAGGSGDAARGVLGHLAVSLVCRAPTNAVEVWVAAGGVGWPAALLALPAVRPLEAPELLPAAVAELRRRMGDPARSPTPAEVILVVPDLADVAGGEAGLDALERIGAHGTDHGVRLLASAAHTGRVPDAALRPFATRAAFQTAGEDESVRVLGCPDAADLAAPPDMLVQIWGRTPLRVRGFVASPGDLDRVGGAMASFERFVADASIAGHPSGARPGDAGAHPAVSPPTAAVHNESPEDAAVPSEAPTRPDPAADAWTPEWDTEGEPHRHESGSVPGSHEHAARSAVMPESAAVAPVAAGEPAIVAEAVALYAPAPGAPPPLARVGDEATATATDACGEANPDSQRDAVRQPPPAHAPDREVLAEPAEPAEATPGTGARLVEVRCFGDLEIAVRGEAVGAAGGLAAQKRPREALAFLAAHGASGVRRDKMLTALWPDASAHQGGRRLTVVLTRIREMLGVAAGDVRCDRDGVVRLDTGVIWSDVHEFLALLKEAKGAPPERARGLYARSLDLYRGDLLESPECDWIHTREGGATLREHYRELWRQAALELARLRVDAGDPAGAVPVYRRLLHLEPTVEDHVRALYRCYEALGDRTAVIMEDRRLRRALREELADPDDPDDDPALYRPHPETVALYEAVLDRLGQRSDAGQDATRDVPSAA